MKKKICIIDYGSGNQKSVFNIREYIGFTPKITNDHAVIRECDYIILPGVGSYGSLMSKLKKKNLLDILNDEILVKKKLYLGICVGMQIMSTNGEEFGENFGLGWIPGVVRRIEAKKKILPHIGWNNVNFSKNHKIFDNIENNSDFYFLNSYCFVPNDQNDILATTSYSEKFISVVGKNNFFGVQFHPEKSQKYGIRIINNFLNL